MISIFDLMTLNMCQRLALGYAIIFTNFELGHLSVPNLTRFPLLISYVTLRPCPLTS